MTKKSKICLVVLFGLLADMVQAADTISLGVIADRLIDGTDIVTKALHVVAILVGLLLIMMSFGLFKANRFNPKYVPLDRPIIYLILGLVLIMIPFLNVIFGPTGSTIDIKIREKQRQGYLESDESGQPSKGGAYYVDIDDPVHAPYDD